MHNINYISDSLQGFTHTENQDGVLVIDKKEYFLAFVFDGVSLSDQPRRAVEAAKDFISQHHVSFIEHPIIHFDRLMYQVEKHLIDSKLKGSLTTYAAIGFFKNHPERLIYSNLGDTRIYLINNGKLRQISTDDTSYPGSNALTRCLGTGGLTQDDFRNEERNLTTAGILIATDGFYSMLERQEPEELPEKIHQNSFQNLKMELAGIIEGQNHDDASYILLYPAGNS
jgi:serine/threonine protein phosphatase PrpC